MQRTRNRIRRSGLSRDREPLIAIVLPTMRFAKSLFEESRVQHRFPYRFDGSFGWLAEQPSHRHNIAAGYKRTLSRQWANILNESGRNEIRIPQAFADFITTSYLNSKIRSISDCYLGLARTFIPFGKGHLLRFLNDSQGCAFWYLYIDSKTHQHCVAICYDYFDEDDDDSQDLSTISPKHFVYDSPSFEAWLCRYWLENEIVFAHHDCTEMPRIPPRYIRAFTIDAYIEDT